MDNYTDKSKNTKTYWQSELTTSEEGTMAKAGKHRTAVLNSSSDS